MTEEEWLTAADPEAMLERLQGTVRDRKWWLFGCCCCDGIRSLLSDKRSQKAIAVAERFVDGLADKDELNAARQEAREAVRYVSGDYLSRYESWVAKRAAEVAAYIVGKSVQKVAARISQVAPEASSGVRRGAHADPRYPLFQANCERQCHSLRCIFGNPFRPVSVEPSWLTSTVTALAEGIYAERAFDRMPILADALEEAGCDHADILNHCRELGEHVRGCWVVDLLTGRK